MFGVELKVVRAVFLPKPSRAPRRLRLGPHVPYLYSFVGRSGAWTRFSNESHENFFFPSNETKPRINRMRQPLSCRCRVRFSKQSHQPCRNLSHLYFWLIRSFTDPAYTCSIFVVRFLVDCLLLQSCSLCLQLFFI